MGSLAFLWLHTLVVGQDNNQDESRPLQLPAQKYPDVDDAILLFKRGNAAAALTLLQAASKKHPEISPPEVMLARLCFASQQLKAGKNALQSAVILHREDPEAWSLLGDLQFKATNWAEAELLFEKAVGLARNYTGISTRKKAQIQLAFNGLIKSYEVRGLWQLAESNLLQWRTFDPKNVNLLRRLAIAQLNIDKIKEATKTLQAVKVLDPGQLPANVSLGLYHQRKGDSDQARQAMNSALRENSQSAATQIAVGRWALSTGDTELARSCAKASESLQKDPMVPQLLLASAELLDGQPEKAEAIYREVYRAHPGNFETVAGLALSLLKQSEEKKWVQGLEHMKVIANTNKDLRTTRGRQAVALLAWALFRNGNIEQADQLMQGIITSGELSPEMAYYAAAIFKAKNRPDAARQLLTRAIQSQLAFVHRTEAKRLLESMKNGEPTENQKPTGKK